MRSRAEHAPNRACGFVHLLWGVVTLYVGVRAAHLFLFPRAGKEIMETACPNCNSSNTMRLAIAYQTGTSTGTFQGLGTDIGGDVGGFGGLTSKQTLFAKQASPPSKPPSHPAGLILFGLGALCAFFACAYYSGEFAFDPSKIWIVVLIAGVIFLLIGTIILVEDHQKKKSMHELALMHWARQWICLKCGSKFKPKKLDFSDQST